MPLNIPLLRAAQVSITDERNPFEMNDYGCCIAGHIYAILYGTKPDPGKFWAVSLEKEALAETAGLPNLALFSDAEYIHANEIQNRTRAIQAIEDLIATYTQPVCAARRSSEVAPRAKAVAPTPDEIGELVGVL